MNASRPEALDLRFGASACGAVCVLACMRCRAIVAAKGYFIQFHPFCRPLAMPAHTPAAADGYAEEEGTRHGQNGQSSKL
jgi:hypothetical protein